MDIHVRQAQPEDREVVVACVQAAYATYRERIGRPPAPLLADYDTLIAQRDVYVLARDSDVRGVLVMRPDERGLFVENVAVDPHVQGQGLGRTLMAFVEERARREHAVEVHLYTNEAMSESIAFYRQLGYAEEGRRVQDGYRRVFLRKRLAERLADGG